MTGKTHKIGGVTFYLLFLLLSLFLPTYDVKENFLMFAIILGATFVGCILGSVIPDIDKKESRIGRQLFFISYPIYFFQVLLRTFFNILNKIFKSKRLKKISKNFISTAGHRGITHWPIFPITGIIIVYVISLVLGLLDVPEISLNLETKQLISKSYIFVLLYFVYGICIGHLSHLVLDSFNGIKGSGISWLAPFTLKRFSIAKIKTCSYGETIFKICLIILDILLVGLLFSLKLNLISLPAF